MFSSDCQEWPRPTDWLRLVGLNGIVMAFYIDEEEEEGGGGGMRDEKVRQVSQVKLKQSTSFMCSALVWIMGRVEARYVSSSKQLQFIAK